MTTDPDMNDWCRRAAEVVPGWTLWHLGHGDAVDTGADRTVTVKDSDHRIILAALLVSKVEQDGCLCVDIKDGMVDVDQCFSRPGDSQTESRNPTLGRAHYKPGDTESRTNATIIACVTALEAMG